MIRWNRLPAHLRDRVTQDPGDPGRPIMGDKPRRPAEPSEYEETYAGQLRQLRLDAGSVREYVFAPPRRWRFDFAWPELQVAVEIEGGVWANRDDQVGRHLTGKGFVADAEKYNEAAIAGWLVLRLTPKVVESGAGLTLLERALQARQP